MDYRAAIVGPEGSGKTTLLEDLRRALDHRGVGTRLLFVNDASALSEVQCRRFLSELGPQELVLLDGADGIPRSAWRLFRDRAIRRAAGLVITSHHPGLLPTLIECSTTRSLLREIVAHLAPPDHAISAALLDGLYTRHHGNLRACLRELYDLCSHDVLF
jgi:GTPase SAR1 family protein